MADKLKSYLLYNANQTNDNSISNKLREKRFKFFSEYCEKLNKPVKILDLGGSDYHWRNSKFANNDDYLITIINNESQNIDGLKNFSFMQKDLRDHSLDDFKDYDVIYSNSLLEHISNPDERKQLSEEIRRIARHYFIQTPNYYFPVEPHFLFPFFQFLPEEWKVKLIMNYDLGWYEKQIDRSKAEELAGSIRLLKKNELQELFPGGNIYTEKYFIFNKSFIVYN